MDVQKGISAFIETYSTFRNVAKVRASFDAGVESFTAASGISKLSLGIGAVTTALTIGVAAWNAHKKSVEEARQKADEAGESLKSTASDIDDYKSKITELKNSISSGTLSKDEEYNAKVQLLSIQDELIEKYGSEAEQLNILTASSDAYCASLDNITQAEARANLRDNGKEYDKAIDEMTKEREFKINLGGIEDTDKALEILKDTLSGNSNISLSDAWGGVKELSVTGDAQDVKAALEFLYDTLEQSNAEGHYFDNLKQMISGDLSQMDDVVSEFGTRYETAIENKIMSGYDNGVSAKAADNIDAYIAAIRDSIAKGDFDAAQENWDFLTTDNLLDGIDDDNIRQYLQDKIDEATSGDFEAQIKLGLDFGGNTDVKQQVLNYLSNFEGEDGVVDTSILLGMDNGDFTSGTNDQIAAYRILKTVADGYGISVSDLVNYLINLGDVQGTVTTAVNDAGSAANDAQESIEGLASAYSTLATAMKEMQNGGLTSDTALGIMSELSESGKNYADYLSVENGKLKLNTAAWIKYANEKNKIKLDDLKAQRDAQQQTIDNLSGDKNTDRRSYHDAAESLNALNSQIEIYEALVNDATSATDMFFDAYSAGESKMSTISDIIESLNTGGATQSQALEWIQQIPELANYYDASTNTFSNMDEALTSIIESDVNSYLSDTNTYLQENADMADESKVALLGLADAYKTMATNTLTTGKAWGVLNKNVTSAQKPFKKLKTQVNNLWNSDAFADARSDLVDLAKKTGITSADIMDLAENNIYLQAMLSETGVSAQFLAQIFESLSLSGSSALDSITDDAIRVNAVLSEMEGPLQKVSLAYEKYQSVLGSWEYDDSFDNFQKAYKDLGEMFDNGEYGADFYRTIDYLYGEGHGADGIENLYKQYKKLGQVFSEDDNGLGFIEKLYANQSKLGGDWVKLDSSGAYLWDIGPEDFAGIAKGLGMTEDEVAACVEALGMFGDFTEYDPSKLVDTFKDLNMTLTDTEGNTVLSEDAIRSMLESLGKEPWQIDQIIAKLREADGLKIYNESDADSVQALITDLETLGKLQIDGASIGADSLTASLRSIGMSDDGIKTVMQTLSGMGYYFTDTAGNAIELNDAIDRIDGTSLENLTTDAENAQKALNDILGKKTFKIDFDSDNVDDLTKNIEYLQSVKRKLTQDDGQTPLAGMESEVQNLDTMLYALLAKKDSLQQPFVMSVDTSGFEGDVYNFISDLQTLYALTQEKTRLIEIGADTSGVQSQIDSTIASINNASPEIKASFGIDESGESSICTAIDKIKDQASLEKIMLNAGVDQTEVDTFLGTEHNADGTVVYNVNDTKVRQYRAPTKPGIVEYSARASSQLQSWTYNKIGYIDYQARYSSSKGKSAGVNGTAHASGNWGTKKSEVALTGELGPEIVVDPDSGTWYTVGDHGAQFANIPQGAIIFNHKQSESLLKYGKVAGRGKAYASGRVSRKNPANGKWYKSSYSNHSGSSGSKSSGGSSGSEADDYLELMDWIEVLIDRIERKISNLGAVADSTFKKLETRTGAVAQEMSAISQEIGYQQDAYNAYINAAEAVDLSDSYKELVRDGKILLEEITDEDLNNRISEYKELYEKALDASDAIVELDNNLSQLYQNRFDVFSNRLDNIINAVDSRSSLLDEYVNQIEESGHEISSKYYDLMIEAQRDKLNSLIHGKNDLIDQLNSALKSGAIEQYSESWYEMKSKIDDAQQSIVETSGKIQELNNQLRQLKWDEFDDARDSVSQLNDEAEFFIDVLSRGDDLFGDNGDISDAGMATMGLRIQEYETYLSQAKAYAEEIKNIEEQLADDPYNTTLLDRKQELVEAQRESVKAALDEKDAIADLVKQGIDLQLDSLSDLIDKYKDSLDAAKDSYEYQKKIKDQTKEIASIEKQLNAYAGDESEETKATIQKLKNDLSDAQDNLRESQYDQYVSDQKSLLDDLYDSYEETLNGRLDDIDSLISECTDAINANSSSVIDTIKNISDSIGVSLSDSIKNIWGGSNPNVSDNVDKTIDSIVGDIADRYSSGSEESIIERMKRNSLLYYTVNSSDREALHSENAVLAEQLSALTGGKVTTKNGAWYDKNGNLLYQLDTDDIIESIVTKMQDNSISYFSASDGEKAKLKNENVELAARLSRVIGKDVYKDKDGTWLVDGKRLYDVYDYSRSLSSGSGSISNRNFAGSALSDKDKIEILSKQVSMFGSVAGVPVTGIDSVRTVAGNMIDIPSNPAYFVSDAYSSLPALKDYSGNVVSNTNNNDFEITFNLPNVKSYEEFMNAITSDRKFEQFIQSITVGRIAGGSKLSKNQYNWGS